MAQGNGAWTDLISEFMLYTESFQSSIIHRTWSAITLVGGACERRIWIDVGDYENYPNLYVFLVAPPGYGKGVIEVVKDLWKSTKDPDHSAGNGELRDAFFVAPENVTRASLVDELAEAKQVRILTKGNPLRNQGETSFIYHSLLVAAEEFELLLPMYDPGFISLLNSGWNNKDSHKETRRHGPAKDVDIKNPQLTIIGGVQPAYFVSHFPENAWETGLARRTIMVYSDEVIRKEDLWRKSDNRAKTRSHILARLAHISTMYGRMRISGEAMKLVNDWYVAGGPPTPTHSKLASYNMSRAQHLIKLAMIAAISRTGEMIIQSEDAARALDWLLEAERRMPNIFRAMTGKSDTQILEELHYFVTAKYRESRKAVEDKDVYEFLSMRATTDKIPGLILTAEKTQRMMKVGNGTAAWIPRPKFVHGVE